MKKLLLFLLFGVMSAFIVEAKQTYQNATGTTKTGTPRKNQPKKGKKQTYQTKNDTTKTGTPRKKKPRKKNPKKTAKKAKRPKQQQTNYDADDDFDESPRTQAPAHTSGLGGGNWASSLQGLLGGAQGTLQQVNALKQQATDTFGGGQAQEEYGSSSEEYDASSEE